MPLYSSLKGDELAEALRMVDYAKSAQDHLWRTSLLRFLPTQQVGEILTIFNKLVDEELDADTED